MPRKKIPYNMLVSLQILQQGIKPLVATVIRRFKRGDTERIVIAHMQKIKYIAHGFTMRRIRDNQTGKSQTWNIKCFARRNGSNNIVKNKFTKLAIQRAEHGMCTAGINQIRMNIIGENC